jgi:large conductance mechanosensitive channel
MSVHANPQTCMLHDFGNFIKRGNVLDLAVGVLIGASFASIIKSLTDNLLSPLIGLALGGFDLSQTFVVKLGDHTQFRFGAIVQDVVNFLITAFVIFMVVQAYNRATKQRIGFVAPTPSESLLAEIRDLLKASQVPNERSQA